MIQPDLSREVRLTIPARQDYALVASMTLCGLGMAAGLDMDLLGDLRTVTCESMDCLLVDTVFSPFLFKKKADPNATYGSGRSALAPR